MRRIGWVLIGLLLAGCGGGGTGIQLPTSQPAFSASVAANPNATATRAAELAELATSRAPAPTASATTTVSTTTVLTTTVPAATVARTPTPSSAATVARTLTPSSAATVARTSATAPTANAAPGALRLVASGYGQAGMQVGVGFIVENTDDANPIGSSQYQITAYDGAGGVLATDSNSIELLLPSQKLGFGATLFLKSDAKVAKVDVQLKPGKVVDGNLVPAAFTTEKATLKPDKSFPKVSGIVKNTYDRDLKTVVASSILYDAAGKIVGAGYILVDLVPANGQAAVDMSVVYAGTPTKVELYAAITSLSGV